MGIIDYGLIWAMSWDNLFMPYANNKGADQPVHPQSFPRDTAHLLVIRDQLKALFFSNFVANKF